MTTEQKTLDNKTPKLFQVYNGDGNDRQETFRFKAFDAQDVVDYIMKNWFKYDEKFTKDDLNVDWQGEDSVYITWSNCDAENCEEKQNADDDEFACDFCEVGESYFEVQLMEQPEPNDFKFNTIEGTNNYVDLTKLKPKQAEPWNKELADLASTDKQAAADELMRLTLANQLPKD